MLPEIRNFFEENRFMAAFVVLGLVLIIIGIAFAINSIDVSSTKVEVLTATTGADTTGSEIIVEIAGAVETPGVYKLSKDARIEDLLIAAGGISSDADREWMEKALNRAAKMIDGQKIYIPAANEQTTGESAKNVQGYQTTSSNFSGQGSGLVNVNNASLKELDTLPGIGPVYGQSIIDHRPYSNIEELLSKGALNTSTYEKIKDLITVY
jgi:competence protein ComEA